MCNLGGFAVSFDLESLCGTESFNHSGEFFAGDKAGFHFWGVHVLVLDFQDVNFALAVSLDLYKVSKEIRFIFPFPRKGALRVANLKGDFHIYILPFREGIASIIFDIFLSVKRCGA
jgi:hypothetical protein